MVPRVQMKNPSNTSSLPKNHSQLGMNLRKTNGAVQPPRKSVMPRPQMAKSPKYSPRKNNANLNPLYSVKYPATNSDSASGRSNGVRLDSAAAATMKRRNPASPQGVSTFQA